MEEGPRNKFPSSGCPLEFFFKVLPVSVGGEFFVEDGIKQ